MNKIRKRAIKLSAKQNFNEIKCLFSDPFNIPFIILLTPLVFVGLLGAVFGICETALTGKESYSLSCTEYNWDLEAIEQLENEHLLVEGKHCYLICYEAKE